MKSLNELKQIYFSIFRTLNTIRTRLFSKKLKIVYLNPDDDFTVVKNLRNEVYRNEKNYIKDELSLIDTYDKNAIILVAYVDGEPVGTLRMNDPTKVDFDWLRLHPGPLENYDPQKLYLHVSRLIVRKKYRGSYISLLLLREVYKVMKQLKADGFIITSVKPLVPYYEKYFGFKLLSDTPIVPPDLNAVNDYIMLWEPSKFKKINLSLILTCLSVVGVTDSFKMLFLSLTARNAE